MPVGSCLDTGLMRSVIHDPEQPHPTRDDGHLAQVWPTRHGENYEQCLESSHRQREPSDKSGYPVRPQQQPAGTRHRDRSHDRVRLIHRRTEGEQRHHSLVRAAAVGQVCEPVQDAGVRPLNRHCRACAYIRDPRRNALSRCNGDEKDDKNRK